MVDECSPVEIMPQWEKSRKLSHKPNSLCWKPVVLLGFLTAAEVPALSQAVRTAACFLPANRRLGEAAGNKVLSVHSKGQAEQIHPRCLQDGLTALGERLQRRWVCSSDRGLCVLLGPG